jgi:hypothetical protein
MDDVVDPSASFRELPRFLTEGLLLTSDRMCQQLRLLLSDVPTSGVHGACRKLQAHGYPGISKQLRSLIQLEEALKIGRGHAARRDATPLERQHEEQWQGQEERQEQRQEQQRQQQRAQTPGGSRPGTRQSMSMVHKYKKTAAALAECILVQQQARDIICEKKPRNAERDRELATAKISCWPAPRNTQLFLSLVEEAVAASRRRAVRGTDWDNWHQRLLLHQETRAMHAHGDVGTLKHVLADLETKKRESFAATDTTEALLMGELRYARKSIAAEKAFENGLQVRWEQDVGGRVADRCKAKLQEIEALEMELRAVTERHQDERASMKRAIAKALRRAEETHEECALKAEHAHAQLLEARDDIRNMAATRKRLKGNIQRELHRLELEAALAEEVRAAEEMWRMTREDVAVPEEDDLVVIEEEDTAAASASVDETAGSKKTKKKKKKKKKKY